VLVIRDSHWAVGWVETILIHESNETALRKADELTAALESYPVLDEEAYAEAEVEAEDEAYTGWVRHDLIRGIPDRYTRIHLKIDALDQDQEYELFREAMEAAGTYFEHGNEGPSIDIDRVRPHFVRLVKAYEIN
jgi:hypothetical protein